MTSRSHRWISWISASTVAALATSTAVAAVAAPAQAKAKAAPVWTKLSTGDGINVSYEPSVARFGTQLLVTWPQGAGTINARVLGASSKPVGPVTNVISGWTGIVPDPRAFVLHGVPMVAFNGSHTDVTTDPLNGPVLYAQPTSATTWALGPGSLTHDVDTSAGYGLGVVDDGAGQPIVAVAGSSTNHLTVHHGFDPSVPAATLDTETANLGETQNVSLARDLKTNLSYAAWYSSRGDASQGVRAAEVYPAVSGASAAAPLSVVTYSGEKISTNPGQNIALAARVGGGVWAAYPSGYPAAHKLVLWNLQTGRTLTINRPVGEVQYVNLSAGPGGRLWVSWVEGGVVYATRTNPAVTAFGVLRAVPAPGGDSATRTAGDGALGPLDAVINVEVGTAAPAIYSARILEGLHVAVSPAKVSYAKGGTVVVSVSDAGVPVSGVSVKVGSAVKVTNAKGRVSFAVPAHAANGVQAVTASGTGWWPGASSFKVG
ncbi:MAG: hypothetical protein QOF39_634 [Frankiales bacterium]|nr:hypothetical protein [Frankiales bacterium]